MHQVSGYQLTLAIALILVSTPVLPHSPSQACMLLTLLLPPHVCLSGLFFAQFYSFSEFLFCLIQCVAYLGLNSFPRLSSSRLLPQLTTANQDDELANTHLAVPCPTRCFRDKPSRVPLLLLPKYGSQSTASEAPLQPTAASQDL